MVKNNSRDQWHQWFHKAGQFAGRVKDNANQNYQNYRQEKLNNQFLDASDNLKAFEIDSKQRLMDFVKQYHLDINQIYDQMVKLDQQSTQTALEVGADFTMEAHSSDSDRLNQTNAQRIQSDLLDSKRALLAGMVNAKVEYRFAALALGKSDSTVQTELVALDEQINSHLSL